MTSPPAITLLRDLTVARVALGRSGVSLPTRALLDFTLSHARARDAVHAAFDAGAIMKALTALGLNVTYVASEARDRRTYLTRPDLGRRLDPDSRARLEQHAGRACDVVLVVGDGLSPAAVYKHAPALVERLLAHLNAERIDVGMAVVVSSARVALGDAVGELLAARVAVVLIGERPGLSAPDSLGVYVTFAPRVGRNDSERNCVSSIHANGLSHDEAAFRIAWLVRTALTRGVSGVTLKDESSMGLLPKAST